MQSPSSVVEVLQKLGATADEVAAALRVRGVQGVRNTVRFLNPIVRYVQAQVVGVQGCDVIQRDRIHIDLRAGQVEEVPLPRAVQEFLEAFDRGLYPDLHLPASKP